MHGVLRTYDVITLLFQPPIIREIKQRRIFFSLVFGVDLWQTRREGKIWEDENGHEIITKETESTSLCFHTSYLWLHTLIAFNI